MNLDMMVLQSFLAVAETGSFTQAAERIKRTQSAISQQIAKVEFLLGKPLFIRDKSLCLTTEGEIFLGYVRQILLLHNELLDRFREPELQGEVRFGIPEDFASVYLSDVLVDFTRIHPRICLNVECDLTLNLYDRFKQGDFDLVLVKMSKPKDYPHTVEVCSEKLDWVGDVNLLRNQHKVVPLILSPTPCVYRARAISALDEAGIKWRLVFSSPSYAGTIAATKAGLGITVLPRTMIPEGLNSIDNQILPNLSDTHVSLLKRNSTPAIVSFEKFVLEKLSR